MSGNQDGSSPSAATRAPGPASMMPCISSVGLPGLAACASKPESVRFCASSSLIRLWRPPISSRKLCLNLHRKMIVEMKDRGKLESMSRSERSEFHAIILSL